MASPRQHVRAPAVAAAAGDAARSGGFTLLELMVVVAIVALVTQVVMFNMGALIPSSVLDSAAKQFMSHVDYVRSEARLNGKTFKIELDLTNQQWRIVMPPEDRLVSDQTIEENVPLDWRRIDERARIDFVRQSGGEAIRQGIVPITFDENGCTADQSISFVLKEDAKMIWTVHIRGLTGQTSLATTVEGRISELEAAQEHQF